MSEQKQAASDIKAHYRDALAASDQIDALFKRIGEMEAIRSKALAAIRQIAADWDIAAPAIAALDPSKSLLIETRNALDSAMLVISTVLPVSVAGSTPAAGVA